MAAVDYGAVTRVNGKFQNHRELFVDIKDAIGRENSDVYDPNGVVYYLEVKENGMKDITSYNYLGTPDFFVALSRRSMLFVKDGVALLIDSLENDNHIPFDRMVKRITVDGTEFTVKRMGEGYGRYHLRYVRDGVVYEAIFGYGVDPNFHSWYDLVGSERTYVKRFMGM